MHNLTMDNLNQYRYIIPEAGSRTGKSAYMFLFDIGVKKQNILAIDCNPKALKEWELLLNVPTMLEKDFVFKNTDIMAACDQLWRVNNVGDGTLCLPSLFEGIRNKTKIHQYLYAHDIPCPMMISNSDLNQYLYDKNTSLLELADKHFKGRFIARPVYGKGSKGICIVNKDSIIRDLDPHNEYIFTEFIDIDEEYVIDFYVTSRGEISVSPRITHFLVNGGDSFVTLLSSNTYEKLGLKEITENIINTIRKKFPEYRIGNVQLMKEKDTGRILFTEITNALSASSSIALINGGGWNPFRGLIEDKIFDYYTNMTSDINCTNVIYKEHLQFIHP